MKQNEKDAKQNSKLARLSETKRIQVRLWQFCFHELLTTILNKRKHVKKWAVFCYLQENTKMAHFFACFVLFRMVGRGSWKQNCRSLTWFCIVSLSLVSLEFCFASFSFSFTLFCIFFVLFHLETLDKKQDKKGLQGGLRNKYALNFILGKEQCRTGLLRVSSSVAEPEPEPQGAAYFGRSRSRSRNAMRLRFRLRQWYLSWLGI
jgi:hypothetical protein